jgi:tRNA(Ile)-lysidine synthase
VAQAGFSAPESGRLDEALRQLFDARADASVRVVLGQAEIRRFRGHAWVIPRTVPPPPGFRARWPGEPTWRIPELGGVLRLKRGNGRGLAAAAVRAGGLEIRLRGGGERFRPDPRRPRRPLKALLQENGVPPWEREQLPLLYCDGRLAWVPGIGVASALQAGPRTPGVVPTWERTGANRCENQRPVQKR